MIYYGKILETHKVLGGRAHLRVNGETSSHEVKILPLKLGDSLLKGHLLFYHWNLNGNIQMAYLSVRSKLWVRMKSGDLVLSQSVIP